MVPPPEVPPAELPTATPTVKGTKKVDSETKAASSEPSLARRSDGKKKKEPSPKPEEDEESTAGTGSFERVDEEERVTPPPYKRCKMDTRSTSKKKPGPEFKTLVASKRPKKTLGKRGSSQKKPRGK